RGNVINYNLKYSTKADRVNTLLRNLKNPSDKTAISKVLKEAEKIYGKDFVQEFTKQEFSLPIVTQAPKQIRNIQPVEMKNIAFVESGGVWTENKKFIKPDTTTKKQEKNKIGQDTTETNWQSKKRFQDSLTGLANVTTLTSGAKISQQNKQQLGQNTLMGQDTLSSQKNKKIIKPITTSQLRQKTDSLFNEWIKQQSNKPELKKPKKILKSSSILKQLSRTIEKEPELFKVFGRRFGEDFLIGKTTDLVKAQQKLKSFLKGTLGRSGTITKQGEAISFQKLKLFGAEFRPAKKNKKRIVQKAKFSLGSFGETSEIQYFKKKSKGKRAIKKLSLFG
ncbi:MAG: hypothetical protein U9Q27_02635, partial [Patescibacteria group bacterium]|nr:hypothetical protein [Patescibacteria group bacterium]